jgi:hypothetical protein
LLLILPASHHKANKQNDCRSNFGEIAAKCIRERIRSPGNASNFFRQPFFQK